VPKALGKAVNDKIELFDVGIISQTSPSMKRISTLELAGYTVGMLFLIIVTSSIQ
jgi:hypothetical protein